MFDLNYCRYVELFMWQMSGHNRFLPVVKTFAMWFSSTGFFKRRSDFISDMFARGIHGMKIPSGGPEMQRKKTPWPLRRTPSSSENTTDQEATCGDILARCFFFRHQEKTDQ